MRLTKTFDEVEVAFIREFAHGELYRLGSMSPPERQERIRVAIMTARLQDKPFRDMGITYAQSYRMVFKKPCELRRFSRETEPKIVKDEWSEELGMNVLTELLPP